MMYIVTNGVEWEKGFRDEIYQALADLTMCFNFLPNPDIKVIGGGWFLGTIFVFYIMFPFFIFLLSTKKRAWFAFAVSLLIHIMTVRYFLTTEFCLQSQIDNARHEITFSFIYLMGGGILYLYKDKLGKLGSSSLFRIILLIALVFASFMQVYCYPTILGENRIYLLLLFALWIIYAMSGGISINGYKFLDNKIMKFFGDISMEIYLTHMMMFRLIEKFHLQDHISDNDLLFVTTYILGITLSVGFAWTVKNKLFPFVEQSLINKH